MCTFHIKDSNQQAVLEIVHRADGKLPQPAEEIIEQSIKPSVKKQNELRHVKALQKGGVGPSTPFRFDVLALLANIPTRITLYELLRLFKFTTDALREALADAEVFITQIPTMCREETIDTAITPRSSFFASASPRRHAS